MADIISIWFGNDLFNDDYEMSCHRRVVGDLCRIELQAAGADEDDAPGRSPEQAANGAAAWREALGNYKDEELLYLEGQSPRWQGRDGADILAVIEFPVGALLELPAPNLAGVIFKLEILWEQDRFESAPDAPFHVEIMRDLNSPTRSIEAAMPQHR